MSFSVADDAKLKFNTCPTCQEKKNISTSWFVQSKNSTEVRDLKLADHCTREESRKKRICARAQEGNIFVLLVQVAAYGTVREGGNANKIIAGEFSECWQTRAGI